MERICRYENNEISKEVDKTRNTFSYIVNDTSFDSMHWVDIFMLQVLIYLIFAYFGGKMISKTSELNMFWNFDCTCM